MTAAIARPRRAPRPNFTLAHAVADARVTGIPGYVLAASAGVSPATLSRLMRGERQPSQEVATRIAEVLGTSVEKLFPDTRLRPAALRD